MYHGTGRCPAYPFRGGYGIIPVEDGNPGHGDGKYHALDQAVEQVFFPLNGALHGRPEEATVNALPVYAHHRAAPDTDSDKNHRQQGHADQTGPEARRNDTPQRIDGHHFQAGNLFRCLHQANFGRQCRAGTPGKQQRGDHRAQFTQQR
ncbi:hypothetical protein D3C79_793320 [compost metagenome]